MTYKKTISLFYSYSHVDETLRDELEKHLKLLQRQQVIDTWHDRKIISGTEWDKVINKNLDTADIILLLVSADFLASDYCWDIEIQRAMQRHEEKTAVVIPVLLRPCDTGNANFMKLQGLPKNFKPVMTWTNQDEAFTHIAKGIRTAAEKSETHNVLIKQNFLQINSLLHRLIQAYVLSLKTSPRCFSGARWKFMHCSIY
jgi:hypothetical protein